MKTFLRYVRTWGLLPAFALALVLPSVYSQVPKPSSDTIKIGTVDIVVPPPEGMVDQYNRTAGLKNFVDAGMQPGNVAMAAYVTDAVAKRLNAGGKFNPAELNPYANIFEPQSVRDMEFTPELFDAFVARTRQQFPDAVDPLTPAILAHIAEKGSGSASPVTNVGNFNRSANTFSVVILTVTTSRDQSSIVTLASTLSYVMVKKRMIYVDVVRKIHQLTELQPLMDFTKKWTAAIADVNK
jgi:hypothetical protein